MERILGIERNIKKAGMTDGRVQNLASHITVDLLKEIHHSMNRHKATGVDQVTKDEYSRNLEQNLQELVKKLKNGSYRPKPSRRVFIPKAEKGKYRPLGISSYEDKLVENAIALILGQIYDRKFYDISYGFRPKRDCHMTVKRVIDDIQVQWTSYVVEADIRSFFDTIDHEWLIKMLEHDIADRKFIDIIKKFLDAGIMENGKYLDSERGAPQGGLCGYRHKEPYAELVIMPSN